MADCKDWIIIQELMKQLRLITFDNRYNTNVNFVLIPKSELEISEDQLPMIMLYYNETALNSENLSLEDSDLDVILTYTDGKCDRNEQESYIERYRNVGADIRMCLMTNPTLSGNCEWIQIVRSLPTLLQPKPGVVIEVHLTNLKIKRTLHIKNPYL
jgi:hypothetical protein